MKRKKKYNKPKIKSAKELKKQAVSLLQGVRYYQIEVKECIELINKKPKKVHLS